jgi:hypothetical protein
MTPMIMGRQKSLDAAEQRTVSLWAVKTAIMMQFTDPRGESYIPAGHVATIYHVRRAPAQDRIWLAGYRGAAELRYWGRKAPVRMQGSGGVETFNAYIVTMALGRLVLQIFGHERSEIHFEMGLTQTHMLQVWPTTGPISWPPEAGLWENELKMFRERLDALNERAPFEYRDADAPI